jgi:hypothetical protein
MNVHVTGRPETGVPVSNGIVDAQWMPCNREVLGDEIAVADEVVLLRGQRTEVVVDDAQDEPEAVAALRSCRVVHHVVGDEIVEDGVVAVLLPSEHLLNDFLRTSLAHQDSMASSALTDHHRQAVIERYAGPRPEAQP